MTRPLTPLLFFALLLGGAGQSVADSISGEIFYTRYTSSPNNVRNASFDYDGSSFTLSAPVQVGSLPNADGIAQNPQNADLLIVGGASGTAIHNVSKSTGAVTTFSGPLGSLHLEVPDSTTVLSMAGGLTSHSISPGGSLSAGIIITLSGDDTSVTQVITTPSGSFYTLSDAFGFGNYGTLTFTSATTATTSRLHGVGGSVSGAVLAAAHGGV